MTPSQQESQAPQRRHWAIPHMAAVAFAIAVYFAVYSVTGDSDIFLALATGAAGGAFTWAMIEIEFWFRTRRRS